MISLGFSPKDSRPRTGRTFAKPALWIGLLLIIVFGHCLLTPSPTLATDVNLPGIRFSLDDANGPQQVSNVMTIVFLMTVISLAPALLIMMTSFTRLAVILSFVKQAMGTQGAPPNQIIVGLALFLTFFIMQPVWQRIHQEAIVPYQNHKISGDEFLNNATKPLKDFMLKQTRKADLALFVSFSQQEKPKNIDAISLTSLVPAFVISELKTAFQIGFLLYLPFIILDMVVSSILLSMGMMMLPPVMISLPFKLMLFVMVDGWNLLIASMVKSFQ